MNKRRPPHVVGRGAHTNPASRFDRLRRTDDLEQLVIDDLPEGSRKVATEYIADDSQSIISSNNSPDLDFRYSLNPYRGCAHGCAYCNARTYHEFLALSGGLDFETKIFYKPDAAKLFRDRLARKDWQAETVTFSGGTDCYQGAEREFELTRQCLEVARACRQPVNIVTKNALVLRDLDILQELAAGDLVQVNLSITSLDQALLQRMEPRTSTAAARLRTITQLVQHAIPTRALLSPIIPGLNDFEIPRLLQAVSDAGGTSAGFSVLRLPGVVREVFLAWLERELPQKAQLVQSRLRQVRGGRWNDARFHHRMTGGGQLAEQIQRTFEVFARRYGLTRQPKPLDATQFRRPGDARQQRLF